MLSCNRSNTISFDGYLSLKFHSQFELQWICCHEQQSGERPQRSSLRSCRNIEDGGSGRERARKDSAQTQETPNPATRWTCALVISVKNVPWLFQAHGFVFLIPQWFTVFSGWAKMLVQYGTYRAYDERMKSVVSAERAHCHWTDASGM